MIAFLEDSPGARMIVGGLTVLERRIRELAKAGVEKVIAVGEPVAMRPMPVPVEYVAAGTAPPAGAQIEPSDVIAGVRVVDDATRHAAEWALLRRMNKAHEGPVDATINWRFSMRITRQLAKTRFTPNHVTIVAILLGLCASWMASRGGYLFVAAAGLLLQVNCILDSCDGELARLRFQYSKLGQWLDNVADDLVDNLFLVAIGYALGGVWLWLGIAAGAGRVFVVLYTYLDVYRRTGTGDVFAFRWFFEVGKEEAVELYDPKQISTWLRSFGRRDTFVFVWFLACVAGFPYWVIGHGLVIAAVQVGLFVLHTTVYRSKRQPPTR